MEINASIIGGSGYVGGEVLRILLFHPNVNVKQVTSENNTGKFVFSIHPNLRKQTLLKFCSINEVENVDVLFLALPHGKTASMMPGLMKKAKYVIDLSSDFRLHSREAYKKWYGHEHTCPELLDKFVYGIPELHREEMKSATYISSAGCNATATILGLWPLYKKGLIDMERTCVEVKAGSSQAGNKPNEGSHHPERSRAVRSYKPTQHRHIAEILQELNTNKLHFSATSIELVRGILATSHVFLKENMDEKKIWKIYREAYGNEPFVRLVKDRVGIYRYPEPKLLAGTNYCDIGFEKDVDSNRIVVISAIDNLMKGAAGQAVQAMNIMIGIEERTGLEFPGLHPV